MNIFCNMNEMSVSVKLSCLRHSTMDSLVNSVCVDSSFTVTSVCDDDSSVGNNLECSSTLSPNIRHLSYEAVYGPRLGQNIRFVN